MSKSKPTDEKGPEADLSATAIVRLAEPRIRLFHSPSREPFASLSTNGHCENWRVKSVEFGDYLSAMCYHDRGGVPSQRTIADAKNTLAGRALFEGPERQVYVRLAQQDGAIYLDLGNRSWEAVRITSEGWEIVSHTPVKFARGVGMQALPYPIDGGTIDDLRQFLNLVDEDHWKMAVGWLLGAFRAVGPYPLLVLGGSHGSAKSTSSRLLRALIEPNEAPLRSPPTNPRDLAISAGNSWCLGFDNLSSVAPWLSDALCRLSTGGGFSTRALYTDEGEKVFKGTRPVMLNGIDIDIRRADLLDRCISVSLLPISEEGRETEAAVWGRFEARQPYILGALLDAVVCALRRVREIRVAKLPRMADFAIWVCAAEPALGWIEGAFLDAYRRNRAEANALALEASSLTKPVLWIADRGRWQGTATQLQAELNRVLLNEIPADERRGEWPATPRDLSHELRRLVPNLREVGVTVEFERTAGDNSERIISIRKSCDDATQATPLESIEG